MHLFYAPNITPPTYRLSEEESRHCVRVLRLAEGDIVHITDGVGNLFCCSIVEASPKRCIIEVTSQQQCERLPYSLTIAIAPTKSNDRYHWFLEKATEVGITEVIPTITAHSERRQVKRERDEKIITSAMKQSLKVYHPTLHEAMNFVDVLTRVSGAEAKFIAHCGDALSCEGFTYLPNALNRGESIEILIGPEGDFSPEEVELALANGYREISLGRARLRTETAALTAVIMVNIANNGCG